MFGGYQSSHVGPEARVAWISTRRGGPAADAIAGNVLHRYVLHDMMRSLTAPLDELSSAHAVVLEAPPIVAPRFEHDMLEFVRKAMHQCPTLAIIVQPSLRRKSNKSLWVHRWNRLHNVPFRFRQTCSCKTGNVVPGCHLTCLIGSTKEIDMSPCAEVPTYCATSQASVLSLGGTLLTLSVSLLFTAATLCCRPTADGTGAPSIWVGPQQTPDSALTVGAVDSALPGVDRDSALTPLTRRGDSALTVGAVDSALVRSRDLALNSAMTQPAFPTDAKEREKRRRQLAKEAGNEHVVQKRKKIMEDHHDDCGEDLSSLHDKSTAALCYPCDYDTDDALSDEDRDQCLRLQFGARIQSFPVDVSKVARAQPDGVDVGPDSRAPLAKDSECPGCRHSRRKDDWEHTRVIGQCRYPYTEPWIPECAACQDRKPRNDPGLSLIHI